MESSVSRCPPFTSTTRGPIRRIRSPALYMSATERTGMSARTSASGMLGVTTWATRSNSDVIAATASMSSNRSPPLATMTGSTTTCGKSSPRIAATTASTIAAFASMPIFTASVPRSPITASICAVTRSAGKACHATTPRVFCAVMAVIALVPNTPCAANVFRSAWMPAPPPESLPAIVSASFMSSALVGIPRPTSGPQPRPRGPLIILTCDRRPVCGRSSPIVQSRAMQNSEALPGTLLKNATSGVRMAGGIRAASVALFVTLTAAAAQVSIPLPFTPVPLTLQPMVVLLGGAVLGARLGMSAQILYLVAGIAGLPVFAASPVLPQGVLRLIGPTGGYLMSYPIAAFVAGSLAERGLDRRYLTSLIAMASGLTVIFSAGVIWLAFFARPAVGLAAALRTGLYPFVLLDLFKLILAAGITPGLWKLLGSNTGADPNH